MNNDSTTTRYVITHIGELDLRTLTFAAQGRNTFSSFEEGIQMLNLLKLNGMARVLSLKQMQTLKVIPCECWKNSYDPTRSYFD